MSYRDTWAVCEECGSKFIFRVEEQRRLAAKGEPVVAPDRCPDCREGAKSGGKPAEEIGPGPHEGEVKWYSGEKGYGFIVHPGGEEIFFHRTGIATGERPNFPEGTKVTYVVEQTDRGPQAVEVSRMDEGA